MEVEHRGLVFPILVQFCVKAEPVGIVGKVGSVSGERRVIQILRHNLTPAAP